MARRTTEEISFGIDGMTCGACVARVEKKLKKVSGVEDASVLCVRANVCRSTAL